MHIYLFSFALFSLSFAGLAVGVIVGRGSIRGSCGGLGNIDGSREDCELCGRATSDCPRKSGSKPAPAE